MPSECQCIFQHVLGGRSLGTIKGLAGWRRDQSGASEAWWMRARRALSSDAWTGVWQRTGSASRIVIPFMPCWSDMQTGS